MGSNKLTKSALESMMFVWGQPLEIKAAADVIGISNKEVLEAMHQLQKEYEEEYRGIVIREVNGAFQFVTREENVEYIERLCTPVKTKKLSQSALEVLAIVAYKQPVTKGEIEAIRGIKCDRVMEGLMEKELVKVVGRSEGIGRPMLYGTTDEFLKKFGFANIKELPEIEDIETAINLGEDWEDGEEALEGGKAFEGQIRFEI